MGDLEYIAQVAPWIAVFLAIVAVAITVHAFRKSYSDDTPEVEKDRSKNDDIFDQMREIQKLERRRGSQMAGRGRRTSSHNHPRRDDGIDPMDVVVAGVLIDSMTSDDSPSRSYSGGSSYGGGDYSSSDSGGGDSGGGGD